MSELIKLIHRVRSLTLLLIMWQHVNETFDLNKTICARLVGFQHLAKMKMKESQMNLSLKIFIQVVTLYINTSPTQSCIEKILRS